MKLIYDIETYKNYFLIMFKAKGKVKYVQMHNDVITGDYTRKTLPLKHTLIGFNNINYDDVMLSAFYGGASNEQLKKLNDAIIEEGLRYWQTYRRFKIRDLKLDTIDLSEPAPGVMISLKMYGARMGMPKLQDLPIEPSATISDSDAIELRKYCINDLDTTEELYNQISKAIELREQLSEKYGVDMRSKSDAQMAESIISSYMDVSKRQTDVKPFKYVPRPWLKFESNELNDLLNIACTVDYQLSVKGSLIAPKEFSKAFEFKGTKYKVAIGGIHSQEKSQVIIPKDDEVLYEADLSSMYPVIITEQGLYPKHLGPKFLEVYSNILSDRLSAKRTGDKVLNETYKITLNGSYGKFGSQYSFLFSPELLIQTTITGQLSIMMIIERLTDIGVQIVSANTDGINVLHKKSLQKEVDSIFFEWELDTGYNFEYTPYSATYNESVNSYIAIKPDGSVKGKGFYAKSWLGKNPDADICVTAVIDYLNKGVPVEDTINNCNDVIEFLTARKVAGGAVYKDIDLGKVVRFYHSTVDGNITYKKNGNKVPKSDSCKPLMDLVDHVPSDLDREWYIKECYSNLKKLGVE